MPLKKKERWRGLKLPPEKSLTYISYVWLILLNLWWAVCVCTQGMCTVCSDASEKANIGKKSEIWTRIFFLGAVWADGVGRSWSHWRRLAGLFFIRRGATAVPLTRETTWHDLPYVCVKNTTRVTLLLLVPPCSLGYLFLSPPEYIISLRVIDTHKGLSTSWHRRIAPCRKEPITPVWLILKKKKKKFLVCTSCSVCPDLFNSPVGRHHHVSYSFA
jgi:hypothetical protein